MKLQTTNPALWGQRLVVPHDGTITIGPDGAVNVSQRCAEALITLPDWTAAADPAAPVATEEAHAAVDEAPDTDQDEDQRIVAAIQAMSLDDMIATATEAGYAPAEWGRFKKKPKLMAAYLIKKYRAAVEATGEPVKDAE